MASSRQRKTNKHELKSVSGGKKGCEKTLAYIIKGVMHNDVFLRPLAALQWNNRPGKLSRTINTFVKRRNVRRKAIKLPEICIGWAATAPVVGAGDSGRMY